MGVRALLLSVLFWKEGAWRRFKTRIQNTVTKAVCVLSGARDARKKRMQERRQRLQAGRRRCVGVDGGCGDGAKGGAQKQDTSKGRSSVHTHSIPDQHSSSHLHTLRPSVSRDDGLGPPVNLLRPSAGPQLFFPPQIACSHQKRMQSVYQKPSDCRQCLQRRPDSLSASNTHSTHTHRDRHLKTSRSPDCQSPL